MRKKQKVLYYIRKLRKVSTLFHCIFKIMFSDIACVFCFYWFLEEVHI